MFYDHSNEACNGFTLWWLLDLDAFRSALIHRHNSPIICGDKAAGDGTYFKWFDIGPFPRELVIAKGGLLQKSSSPQRFAPENPTMGIFRVRPVNLT